MTPKRVLVTAGNTRIPIDQVRGIDNVFKGRTGVAIAEYFADRGCEVILLTSHPYLATPRQGLTTLPFKTFDNLRGSMRGLMRQSEFDVIIHSAAVSDYQVGGVYGQLSTRKTEVGNEYPELLELNRSGKIGSGHDVMWLKLVPTIKIVDQIRQPWGFKGTLVKFKLQVGVTDAELIQIATDSMNHSQADFIVANTLEGLTQKAFIVSAKGELPKQVGRKELPARLYEELGL